MLFLIGVAHRAQAKSPCIAESDAQRQFAHTLRAAIKRICPVFLAEEDSEESLSERGEVSIARKIADEMGIEHRFCDPTKSERAHLGYKDQMTCHRESFLNDIQGLTPAEITMRGDAVFVGCHFPTRERFWLGRLGGCRDRSAIFVCGDGHIESDSFRKLLEHEEIPYEVVARGIGVTEEDGWINAALQYLQKYPHLKEDETSGMMPPPVP